MRLVLFLCLTVACGCLPEPPELKPFTPEDVAEDRYVKFSGWTKHDRRECKYFFGQEVVISQGFYRGSKGAVMDLREDGYVIDLAGYLITKPSGSTLLRDAIIYGVPESDLKPYEQEESN